VSSHPFRPLRRRSVLLVWGAGVISDVGTWVQMIVVGSLVASSTGSAVYTGLTALAMFTPQGLCSPIGGLLADRYDRRHVFIAALLGQATATSVLAVTLASGNRDPFVLSGIIMLASAAGAIGQPAFSAMLPDLVPPEELMAMVALGIHSWNAGRIMGPLLGTILVTAIGPAWTIGFNAATFAGMAAAIALLRRSFVPPGSQAEGIRDRLAEGWHVLQTVAGCRYGIVMIMILNLTVAPFMGLIPIYARELFDGETALAGGFSALQGAGAIVGGLLLTTLVVRVGRARLLVVTVALLVVGYLGWALAPTPWAAGAAVLLLGGATASLFVSASTIIQRDAPASERGRILSISQAGMGTCYGVGMLWISSLGDFTSLREAFLVAACVAGLSALVLGSRIADWRQVVDGTAVTDQGSELAVAPA
jgi:MFS family permease